MARSTSNYNGYLGRKHDCLKNDRTGEGYKGRDGLNDRTTIKFLKYIKKIRPKDKATLKPKTLDERRTREHYMAREAVLKSGSVDLDDGTGLASMKAKGEGYVCDVLAWIAA
ncbi:hypothetical protein GX50_00161 [[Emmonsia] crescens]|uniref:Uncharacterized protein n=1 Tax=[Emmonsia] crescens TaxID=73230 RepID=A0A2B7ZVX9_9EURO|nr:hypothetical protein GX50_00161 [Emmonsia crescens]